MVKYNAATLDDTFMALSDGTRRAILARLAEGDAQVSELAQPFKMSLPAVSKHLGILERAGLIVRHRDGRVRRCSLQPGALRDAAQWIDFYRQFWQSSLDSLADYLDNSIIEEKPDDTR